MAEPLKAVNGLGKVRWIPRLRDGSLLTYGNHSYGQMWSTMHINYVDYRWYWLAKAKGDRKDKRDAKRQLHIVRYER